MDVQFFTDERDIPVSAKKRDLLSGAYRELFFIEHPAIQKSADVPDLAEYLVAHEDGVWVYYSWLDVALRIPNESVYTTLRTARNRNLITDSEQATYRAGVVGIAGLSVGSTALSCLVSTGGPRHIKIADPDTIEITNLNRIQASLSDVTLNKTDVAARRALELDPFLHLELWNQGIQSETMDRFLGDPRLGVFIDEMDDIRLKIESRNRCRALGIPVVMATDNGDGAILDIERFDLEKDREIFHGRVQIRDDELHNIDRAAFVALANKIIDVKQFTPRQWESIQQIGTTLSGVPQLGSAAMIAGAAVAYATRTILTGAPLASGRYVISCESMFA